MKPTQTPRTLENDRFGKQQHEPSMVHRTPVRRHRASIGGGNVEGGFTLVELLVTIAMIVVLAAIIFVAYRTAIDRAKSTGNASNLRSLSTQMQRFASEYGYFPPGFDKDFPSTSQFTAIRWPEILLETSGLQPPSEEYLSPTKGTVLEPGLTWQPLNYAANVAVCYRTGGQRVRPANIHRPNEIVLIGDVTTKVGEENTKYKNGNATFSPTTPTLTAASPAAGQQPASFWTDVGTGQPDYRNSGSTQMIFVDGHLVAFKKGELKAKHFSISY